MTFAHPWLVAGAVVLAALFVVAAVRSERRARAAALDYSSIAFLDGVIGRAWPWTTIFAAGWALAIAAGGFALARPSLVANVATHDASVVLCIDTSGSMASTDVYPTRSGASRAAAEAFIDGVPDGTRIGLVAFSTAAIPLGALTDDKAVARDELAQLPAPDGGTAIGDALAVAAKLLPPGGRRAIVLVTDGVNNHGSDPTEVASAVGARGIAIFTVGIGTNDSGLLIPGTGEDASIDEESLQDIARAGHGSYARVADAAALSQRLIALAQTSVRERRRVDLTLPFALGSGVVALGAALAALALGRFP
jgi:Ca-activated chloride channel family protein